MRTKNSLLVNALKITAFSLTVKLMGMLFRLYLTGRMGTEGMGLYQLIMSVYGLFATLSTAGLTVTVSGLASRQITVAGMSGGKLMLNRAVRFSLFISIPAAVIMFIFSPIGAKTFIGDIRTTVPLQILAFSMPFMAVAACLKGWFFATVKPILPSIASLLEQTAKICVTMLITSVFMAGKTDIAFLCVGTVTGITAGEIFSFFVLWLMYLRQSRGCKADKENKKETDSVLRQTCLPIGLSACMTSLMHTCESVLIPKMLCLYDGSYENALSDFGIIRGMAIPLLFFPFSFLSSLVSVTVPEISRLSALQSKDRLKERVSKILTYSWAFALCVSGLFFVFPQEFSIAFYHTDKASHAIRILACVTPFMYIETMTDGMLKSIGEQMYTFIVGLINSAIRIVAVLTLIPKSGTEGYLWLLIASNTFSYVMCACRLKKKTGSFPAFKSGITLPLISFAVSGGAAYICKSISGSTYPKVIIITAVYLTLFLITYSSGTLLWKTTKK